MNLTDIYITFIPTAAEYILFTSAHGTFSRIHSMLGQKTSFNKFKNTEIIASSFLTTMERNWPPAVEGKFKNSQACGN